MKTLRSIVALVFCMTLTILIFSCGGDDGAQTELKLTFHDKLVDGTTIKRIDMKVLETQIIDIYDNKTVISSVPQSFNLLEVTKNNPVVLAHTQIVAGTYKQIRIVLDDNTTITFTDGTTHPLNVPSGEMTGIKIDGIFEIPVGRLYTLDIDLKPGHSVHYAPGNAYMLKPVITLSGSNINSGNFFYASSYGGEKFVIELSTNNNMRAKTSKYSKYLITGYYVHDGVHQTLTVVPQDVKCPSCSWWKKKKLDLFGDVPDTQVFKLITFGADYIDLLDSSGELMHLYRVSTFSLGYTPPTKDFAIHVPSLEFAWKDNESTSNEKVLFGQLIPENGLGRGFADTATIQYGNDGYLEYSIPESEFDSDPKSYILTLGIVNSMDMLILSSDGTIIDAQNVVAHNFNGATKMNLLRGTTVSDPVKVTFLP